MIKDALAKISIIIGILIFIANLVSVMAFDNIIAKHYSEYLSDQNFAAWAVFTISLFLIALGPIIKSTDFAFFVVASGYAIFFVAIPSTFITYITIDGFFDYFDEYYLGFTFGIGFILVVLGYLIMGIEYVFTRR